MPNYVDNLFSCFNFGLWPAQVFRGGAVPPPVPSPIRLRPCLDISSQLPHCVSREIVIASSSSTSCRDVVLFSL